MASEQLRWTRSEAQRTIHTSGPAPRNSGGMLRGSQSLLMLNLPSYNHTNTETCDSVQGIAMMRKPFETKQYCSRDTSTYSSWWSLKFENYCRKLRTLRRASNENSAKCLARCCSKPGSYCTLKFWGRVLLECPRNVKPTSDSLVRRIPNGARLHGQATYASIEFDIVYFPLRKSIGIALIIRP